MKVVSLVGLLIALPTTNAVEYVQNVILGNDLRAEVQEVDGKRRYLVRNCVIEASYSVSVVSQVSDSEGARRLDGVSTCIVEVTSSTSVSTTAGDTSSLEIGEPTFEGLDGKKDPKPKPSKIKAPTKKKGPKTKGPKTKGPKTKGPKTKGPKTKNPKKKNPKKKGP